MNSYKFLTEFKTLFNQREWSWLLIALQRDPLVWSTLTETDLGLRALENLPPQPEAWSPAALSLLEIDQSLDLDIIRSASLSEINPLVNSKAEREYERFQKTMAAPNDLAKSGLAALFILERFRVNESWDATLVELGDISEAHSSILVCLSGMLAEPEELLRALWLFDPKDVVQNLALHVLLSNPISPETQEEILLKIGRDLPAENILGILEILTAERPWLASALARDLLSHWSDLRISNAQYIPDEMDQLGQLYNQMDRMQRLARVQQIAGHPEDAIPVLSEVLQVARRVRGHLSAQLAILVEDAERFGLSNGQKISPEKGLEAWKQAVQLIPDERRYSAGLAGFMLKSGKLDETKAYLEKIKSESLVFSNPAQALVAAKLANHLGENDESREAALRALELLDEKHRLNLYEFVSLAEIFEQLHMPAQAARTVLLASNFYTGDPQLQALKVRAQHQLGKQASALPNAYTALALQELQSGFQVSEDPEKPISKGFSREVVRSLLVDSLEAAGEWQAALGERLSLLEGQDIHTTAELRALANCAIKAGEPGRALQVSRQMLDSDPDDPCAYQLCAEASLALGDTDTAIDNLKTATRLAPQQAKLWIDLAQAYTQAGLDNQAVETLQAAIQAAPDDPQGHLALGETYLRMKSYAQALPLLRRAAGLSSSERISLRLGQTLHQLGHLEEAEKVLSKAYEASLELHKTKFDALEGEEIPALDPELTSAYARTLIEIGEYSQAISLLEDVVQNCPHNALARLDLAKALIRSQDLPNGCQRAITLLKNIQGSYQDYEVDEIVPQAHNLSSIQAQTQALLAEALAGVGDDELALKAYHLALESPINRELDELARLSLGLGLVALRLNQPETALAAIQEAARADPHNSKIQRNLGEAYLANELYSESLLAAKTARELKPNDLETLIWFADLGLQLQDKPEVVQSSIQSEVLQVLHDATKLKPTRGELWLRLGELLLENDEHETALQVFQNYLDSDGKSEGATVEEIFRSARKLRAQGDTQTAIALLERALERYSQDNLSNPDVNPDTPKVSLADLYAELALAFVDIGDREKALQALDQALDDDSNRVVLYQQKADLLFELGNLADSLENLRIALQLDPQAAGLHYRIAKALRGLGDLPSALGHAEHAIVTLDENERTSLEQSIRLLASELAYVMLKPQAARAYLQSSPLSASSLDEDFRFSSMQAELALDAGEEAIAAQALEKANRLDRESARCRANRARLAMMRGEFREGLDLIKSILNDIPIDDEENLWIADWTNDPMSLLAVGQTALDYVQWKEAISLFRRLSKQAPKEPLSHLRLAQALVLRAEASSLCQDLEIESHSPGDNALSEKAWETFDEEIKSVEKLVGAQLSQSEKDAVDWWDDESQKVLNVWRARGRAVFSPGSSSVQALQNALKVVAPRPGEVAALMMVLRRNGDLSQAVMAAQLDWHPNYTGTGITGHPMIMVQLALGLESINPGQAFEVAGAALERSANDIHDLWPDISMFNYLLARIAHSAGEYTAAQEAIQKALNLWPEEPRWHALAAKIYLVNSPEDGLPNKKKALYHLEEAARLESKNIQHLLALGSELLRQGQAERAAEVLEKASLLQPEEEEIWMQLAQAQLDAGNLEDAALSSEKAIEVASEPMQALLLRGEIALQANNPRGALNRVQAVLKMQPNNAHALYLLARVLEALKRPEEALVVLNKAAPMFENPLPILVERVQLIRRMQNIDAALTTLRELSTQYPEQPELQALLADWLMETGKQEEAIRAARLALQESAGELSNKRRSDLHYLVGMYMRQSGQLDQAIFHLSEAIEQSPDHLETYLELGRAYHDRREYKQALKVYQKAIGFSENDYRLYYQAGLVLKDSKDYLAAEKMLRRAVQLAPNEVNVHRLLGAVVALNLVHNRRVEKIDA